MAREQEARGIRAKARPKKAVKTRDRGSEHEARTTRGAARSRNAVETHDGDGDETVLRKEEATNSSGMLTPTSAIQNTQYWDLHDTEELSDDTTEEMQVEDRQDVSLHFSESSDSHADSQVGYPMLVDPGNVMHQQQNQVMSGNEFQNDCLGHNPGGLHDGDGHGNMYARNDSHAAEWVVVSPTSEMIPGQYTGDLGRPLPLRTLEDANPFGHYPTQHRHKMMFPNDIPDCSANHQGNFATRQEGIHPRFPAFNMGAVPSPAGTYYNTAMMDGQPHPYNLDHMVEDKPRQCNNDKLWGWQAGPPHNKGPQ